MQLDSDSVVFSGNAQVSRFGPAAGFDFNTGEGATSSGLLIEQGLLAAEDRNKPVAILAAKKLLAEKYPNAKAVLKEFPFEK